MSTDTTPAVKKYRNWIMWVIITVVLFIVLTVITYKIATHEPKKTTSASTIHQQQVKIPLASSPVAEWPKLVLQPGGKSERIPVPPGMRPVMDGNRFLGHTVYVDGHECVRDSENPGAACADGSVTGAYATNKANETNIVSYAYAPI